MKKKSRYFIDWRDESVNKNIKKERLKNSKIVSV